MIDLSLFVLSEGYIFVETPIRVYTIELIRKKRKDTIAVDIIMGHTKQILPFEREAFVKAVIDFLKPVTLSNGRVAEYRYKEGLDSNYIRYLWEGPNCVAAFHFQCGVRDIVWDFSAGAKTFKTNPVCPFVTPFHLAGELILDIFNAAGGPRYIRWAFPGEVSEPEGLAIMLRFLHAATPRLASLLETLIRTRELLI